jgi:hypothetical protein
MATRRTPGVGLAGCCGVGAIGCCLEAAGAPLEEEEGEPEEPDAAAGDGVDEVELLRPAELDLATAEPPLVDDGGDDDDEEDDPFLRDDELENGGPAEARTTEPPRTACCRRANLRVVELIVFFSMESRFQSSSTLSLSFFARKLFFEPQVNP